MKNITQQFNCGFEPFKALLIYRYDKPEEISQFQREDKLTEIYVECYDIGRNGKPINAHLLNEKEMSALSELLRTSQEAKNGYLKSRGLLPSNVLYVDQKANGYAVWYTPPQEVDLYFVGGLRIPSGKFQIPAMIWKADADHLAVYGLKGKAKPHENARLYHAPYLNIYGNGQVCMGPVQIDIEKGACLEDFISRWQQYFFDSNFSHSISGNSSTKTNTTELWRSLAGTGKVFPQDELIRTSLTLKDIIR